MAIDIRLVQCDNYELMLNILYRNVSIVSELMNDTGKDMDDFTENERSVYNKRESEVLAELCPDGNVPRIIDVKIMHEKYQGIDIGKFRVNDNRWGFNNIIRGVTGQDICDIFERPKGTAFFRPDWNKVNIALCNLENKFKEAIKLKIVVLCHENRNKQKNAIIQSSYSAFQYFLKTNHTLNVNGKNQNSKIKEMLEKMEKEGGSATVINEKQIFGLLENDSNEEEQFLVEGRSWDAENRAGRYISNCGELHLVYPLKVRAVIDGINIDKEECQYMICDFDSWQYYLREFSYLRAMVGFVLSSNESDKYCLHWDA